MSKIIDSTDERCSGLFTTLVVAAVVVGIPWWVGVFYLLGII